MRLQLRPDILLEEVEAAFEQAVDDSLTDAKKRAARHSRTGDYERSLRRTRTVRQGARLSARIGSPRVSAVAKEKGAYITAQRAPYLVLNAGGGVRKVKSVRLAPQPSIVPAGKGFPERFATAARARRAGA